MVEGKLEKLKYFVANHLDNIRQDIDTPSRELRTLQIIVKPENLSLPEVMALAESSAAIDLRGANNTTPRSDGRSGSPAAVDFDFDKNSSIESSGVVEEQVVERINVLEEAGERPSPLPEVNSTTIGGFVSNMTNYITATVALPTTAEILAARRDPKNARIITNVANTIADEVFAVVAAGGDMSEMSRNAANRVLWGAGTTIAANISTNVLEAESDKATKLASSAISQGTGIQGGVATSIAAYVGETLKLSPDNVDNLGNVVIGTIKHGSLSSGLANASENFLFRNAWKGSGGSEQLSEVRSLGSAKEKFIVSKELSNMAMKYFTDATEIVSEVAKQSIVGSDPTIGSFLLGGFARESIKIGAQAALLGGGSCEKLFFYRSSSSSKS